MSEEEKVLVSRALAGLKKSYGDGDVPVIAVSAPGRVNLIGEHTDYNDGFVLPMALPLYTVVVGRATNSGTCRVTTLCPLADHPNAIEFPVPTRENPLEPGRPKWANYVKGVVTYYAGKLSSFDAVIATSVPIGGGLSSSASLEVAFYAFLDGISPEDSNLSLVDKAKACQRAENDFAGVPCGIMDQFVAFKGKKGHALLIDCLSLESNLVPLARTDISVLVTNSKVRHELTGTEYSSRRRLCEEVAKELRKASLRHATLEDAKTLGVSEESETFRRVRHVITEIERTQAAALALKRGDFKGFGHLMVQSHHSLRDDYEVSCPELDLLVSAALEVDGVYGSRMTGGGFGGCTVTLLRADAVEKAIKLIRERFQGDPEFYVCKPVNGAHVIKLK